VQRASGSLGAALSAELDRTGDLRLALSAWTAAIRRAGGLDTASGRGAQHILADPAAGSAAKRLMLLLRWMSRPADGVDLGLWDIPTSLLLVPVDTHIHKLHNLGFTSRKSVSAAAEEITRGCPLRRGRSGEARLRPLPPRHAALALPGADPARCEAGSPTCAATGPAGADRRPFRPWRAGG
jgi:hypothetical protein